MAKKLVSQEATIKIIEELVLTDHNPTVSLIRERLQSGSETTIHKYLSQWKQKCFKQMVTNSNYFDSNIKANIFVEEKRVLEQKLNKQVVQTEYYAQELINTEKANIALKEENRQLHTANQELQVRIAEAKAANHFLEQITQEIKNRLDTNDNKTFINMQQTIDNLRLELKTLNETSLNALRETSNKGHEVLMQEKVNSINLQAKIDSLTKELLEGKKQTHEAMMMAQVQIRSLSRENKQLQKIIQEHDLGKLPQLEDELRLNFNKEAKDYGK